MSDDSEPNLKTDFIVKQASTTSSSMGAPAMVVLGLVGIGVIFGGYQLVNYLINYDKIAAMKNVDIQLTHPLEKDGQAVVSVEIANFNPQTIQNTTFSYSVTDAAGKVLKDGKVTIPTVISAGESRVFPEISIGNIQSGRMHAELTDLKPGPKSHLTPPLAEKFIQAAGLKPKESLRAFVEIVQADPEFAPGYVHLGEALAANNDLESSIKAFHKALALDPDDVSAHYNLGLAYFYSKNKQAAKDEFEAASKLEPDDPAVIASLKQLGGK